jgi:hypothetical protein
VGSFSQIDTVVPKWADLGWRRTVSRDANGFVFHFQERLASAASPELDRSIPILRGRCAIGAPIGRETAFSLQDRVNFVRSALGEF